MKKGTLGYIRQLKSRYLISALIAAFFLLSQFFLRNISEEWISRYFTIGMGIAIIPIGLYAAKLLSIGSYKQDDWIFKEAEENPRLYDNALMELILIHGKQAYFINAIFYAEDILWLYTHNNQLTMATLTEIFNRKALDVEISIIKDKPLFLEKIDKATKLPEEIENVLFQVSS